jgi:DNA-binding MarR family transcriptional regulator
MPDHDISEYLAFLLASAHRRMRLGLAQSIASEDVTEEQWRILQVLSDEQGRSMGELAERVLMNHPALTKNIDKLVGRSLVQRSTDASDSRKVLVYISDLGLETVGRLKKSVDGHHDAVTGALGARKTEQLKKLLKAFIDESAPQS